LPFHPALYSEGHGGVDVERGSQKNSVKQTGLGAGNCLYEKTGLRWLADIDEGGF